MKKAKLGDIVKIIYSGQTEDGAYFETSADTPLGFTIGGNEVIAGLEKSVVGMQVGEKKSLAIPPEDGFGQRRAHLVETVNKAQFPNHITPKEGQRLRLKNEEGDETEIKITKVEKEMVTLDANHPLSGKTLKFEIELVDIQ